MLVFRHLLAVSIGAVIVVSYGAAATAQTVNSLAQPKDNTQTEVGGVKWRLIDGVSSITRAERAEENLRQARLGYQAGVGRQTEVIEAQRSLVNARGSFKRSIIQYNRALNQLQRQVSNMPDSRLFNIP